MTSYFVKENLKGYSQISNKILCLQDCGNGKQRRAVLANSQKERLTEANHFPGALAPPNGSYWWRRPSGRQAPVNPAGPLHQ